MDPLTANPYATAKIYAVRSPHTDKVYIGATTTSLGERMIVHRSRFKRDQAQCRAKEIFECGDAYMELIEEYPCLTRAQLSVREAEILDENPTAVNKNRPGRSRKQWLVDNKEKVKAYTKAYKAAKKAEKRAAAVAASQPADTIEALLAAAAAAESPAPE
jgi:hypothetical protein